MSSAPRRPADDAGPLPPVGIGKLLRRSHLAFSKILRDRLKDQGITFSEFVHLERLWYNDGLNQTELSRRVGIETASSTSVLDTLEKRGYIRRERDPNDRRNIRIFLKPAGAELEARLLECAARINAIARDGLSKADITAFFRITSAIAENLEAHNRGVSASRDKSNGGRKAPRANRAGT